MAPPGSSSIGSPIPPADPVVPAPGTPGVGPSRVGLVVRRGLLLVVMAVVLYVLLPALVSVFGAWHDLRSVSPLWFIAMIVAETASFALVSLFTRLVLPTASLFGISCAQLSGHALSTVVPGGAATGG